MRPAILIAPWLATLAVAAPAGAATVSVTTSSHYDPGGKGIPAVTIVRQVLGFAAAAGEANRLVVTEAGGAYQVRDPGAALTAGAGCAATPDGGVACPVQTAAVRALDVDLGDGDDTAELTHGAFPSTVRAGPGEDAVGAAGGTLDGGEGADMLTVRGAGVLRGGPGPDSLTGGDGADTLDGGPGMDVLDAGGGRDVLSYEGRAEAIAVDLAAPTAGAAGEEDRISGFEGAAGGSGPDTLRAGAGAATLSGGGGHDALVGGPAADELDGGAGGDRIAGLAGGDKLDGGLGDDALEGGPGRDRVYGRAGADVASGGPGNDTVDDLEGPSGPFSPDMLRGDEGDDDVHGGDADTAEGGAGDDELYGTSVSGGPGDDRLEGPQTAAGAAGVDCGPGRDTLVRPSDRALVPAGCERVRPWIFGSGTLRVPPVIAGRSVGLRAPNPCLFAFDGTRCRVSAALFVGGRHVGTATARWRRHSDGRRWLRWRLARADRRVLARGATLRVRLVKHETDSGAERAGYSVRLP